MSQAATPTVTQRLAREWDVVVLVMALLYFVARVVYLVFHVASGIGPDEATHLGISEVFAKTFWIPADSPDSYRFGLISHSPSFYYYAMGRLINVNLFFASNLRWLRLANMACGVLTVVYGFRWMKLFTPNKFASSLFAVMVTNIPMFTFLSGSVNYDNLTNLLAAMSIYYLTRFFADRRGETLGVFLATMLLGSLTKFTFLPLSVSLALVLVAHERRNLAELPRAAAAALGRFNARGAAIAAGVLLLAAINVNLYGGNWLKYERLTPLPQQILSLDQCLQNPVFARDYITQRFQSGEITALQAAVEANRISDLEIKGGLVYMLNESLRQSPQRNPSPPQPTPPEKSPDKKPGETVPDGKPTPAKQNSPPAASPSPNPAPAGDAPPKLSAPRMSVWKYAQFWIGQITRTTFGILAKLASFKTAQELWGYGALAVAAVIISLIAKIRAASAHTPSPQASPANSRKIDPPFGRSIGVFLTSAIVVLYALALFYFNYNHYLSTGAEFVAVQGRYLFPVLVPMYGLIACLLVCYWPRPMQAVVAAVASAWFIYGDLPFFLATATPGWFG